MLLATTEWLDICSMVLQTLKYLKIQVASVFPSSQFFVYVDAQVLVFLDSVLLCFPDADWVWMGPSLPQIHHQLLGLCDVAGNLVHTTSQVFSTLLYSASCSLKMQVAGLWVVSLRCSVWAERETWLYPEMGPILLIFVSDILIRSFKYCGQTVR